MCISIYKMYIEKRERKQIAQNYNYLYTHIAVMLQAHLDMCNIIDVACNTYDRHLSGQNMYMRKCVLWQRHYCHLCPWR